MGRNVTSGRKFGCTIGRNVLSATLAFSLVACGGGGNGGGGPIAGGPTPTPTPTPTTSACSVSARQDFALAVLNEWYLFPDLLDTTVSKSSHATVQSYIDALVAPARAQSKDRGFTYITSIEEETGTPNAEQMIRQLILGQEAVVRTAREVIPLADNANDEPTADLLTQRMQTHEKTAWMLRSMLGQ